MKKLTLLLMSIILLGIIPVQAQNVSRVSGTVTSASDGLPIPGVSVFFKGTTVGEITDINGKYDLEVPKGSKILVLSFVGMKTVEVPINKSVINVKMQSNSTMVGEVLVVAYGTARKEAFTGSAVQVDSDELEKRQVSNVLQALTGKVAGIQVTSGNNQPGTSPNIKIRGVGSFSASTSPLYVVDGVPYSGDISSINPKDIESTTVLKDAASAALYGARGANGVILITTKSGSSVTSDLKVSVDAKYGLNSRAIPDYDFMTDPGQYASKYFESVYNYNVAKEGVTPEQAFINANAEYADAIVYVPFTVPEGQDLFVQNGRRFSLNQNATVGRMLTGSDGANYWLTPDKWSDEVFESNPRQEYNVSISGKKDKASYYFSAGFLDDQGYIVSSGFNRFSTRLRSDYDVSKMIKIGANLSYTHYKANRLDNTTEGGNSGNIFAVTNHIAPIFPVYVRGENKQIMTDKWGNQLYDFGTEQYPGLKRPFLAISNPMSLYKLDTKEAVADVVSAKGYIDIKPLDGLTFKMSVGYDVDNTYGLWKANVYYGQFADYGGIVERWYSKDQGLNLQQLITYENNFDNHNYDILLGHEYFRATSNDLSGQRENMYYPGNTEVNGAIVKPTTYSSMGEYATEGYFGRLQYDYNEKYFASLSYRKDASSRFHKDHRWGDFWSVGTSWLINKENFLSSIEWIDLLKFKASYGEQGNDAIGSYRYTDLYTLKNANDQLAVVFNSKGNEDITWETSKNLNVGLEYELFNNILSGGLDYFSREVTDMLFWRPVPRSAGYSGYYDNVGAMKNSGVEFYIKGQIIDRNDLKWSISLNGSHVQNELTKLPEEWEAVKDGYRDGTHVYKVGESIYDRAYPHYLGVNDEGKSVWQTYNKDTGEYGETTDHSIAVEKDNRKIYNNIDPLLVGGLSSNLEAYGFDMSFTFTYGIGGKVYDGTYASLMHGGTQGDAGHNWHKDILDSWTPENKDTDVPMVDYGSRYANSYSDRFLTDRDYLALDNITVGYNLSKNVLDKVKIDECRVYLAADNVKLWSARKGLDPRFEYSVGYQAIRTVSLGVRATF